MPCLLERIGVYSFNDEEAMQMNIYTQNSESPNTLVPSLEIRGTLTSTMSIRGKPALY